MSTGGFLRSVVGWRLFRRKALAGRRVVRLKGGDPMVFGRAAEEIDALRAAGLPVLSELPGMLDFLAATVGALASATDPSPAPPR